MDLLGGVFVDERNARRIVGPAITHIIRNVIERRDLPFKPVVDFFVGLAALQ